AFPRRPHPFGIATKGQSLGHAGNSQRHSHVAPTGPGRPKQSRRLIVPESEPAAAPHLPAFKPFALPEGPTHRMEQSRPGVIPTQGPVADPSASGDSGDVALAVRGDAQAFRRLYEAHVGRIHSLACRMIGPDHAAEATQDVFVRVWRKLGSFR